MRQNKGEKEEDLEPDAKGQEVAMDLLHRMQDAVAQDRASNIAGKPALKRLMMANDVYSQLKKISVQENFLDGENKGC